MKVLNKQLVILTMGMLAAGVTQANDMGSAVAYSLGEFDRVGINQSMPKAEASERAGGQKQHGVNATQTKEERQLAARKAEFVRRMFWLALSVR